MAFKLTKAELAQRGELNEQLQSAWEAVEAAQAAYNEKLDELKAPVEEAVTKFNELAQGAVNEFAQSIASRADEEFGNKSERWQEGDKGQEASSWKDEYENFEIPELEVEFPSALEISQPDMDLTELPEQAE